MYRDDTVSKGQRLELLYIATLVGGRSVLVKVIRLIPRGRVSVLILLDVPTPPPRPRSDHFQPVKPHSPVSEEKKRQQNFGDGWFVVTRL